MKVTFEETGEEREVKDSCLICYPRVQYPSLDSVPEEAINVVSAGGIAHQGSDYGMTYCGKDATGPNWWWRY